jgi:SSS family solute:Na+ symporter
MSTTLTPSLHPADVAIIVAYFVGMAWIGWRFSKQSASTEGYFLGGHKLPAWAIGLSMLATSISSITFLAFPAAAFALDWRMSVNSLTNPLGALLAVLIFIPFFRSKAQTTAFEYLFGRFGSGARIYGSVLFLVAQALRMGSILYLMALPLTMMTGWDPLMIMLFVGFFTAIYTIFGGMSAVVWTDVAQTFTLYIGGVAAIVVMILNAPGGAGQLVGLAAEAGKFSFGPMEWNLDERTFWTLFIVGITQSLNAFSTDQTVVQRYLAASTEREARSATLLCGFLSLPTWLFFTLIGTLMWAFYQALPDPRVAQLPADDVFPHFIITVLPMGLKGLVLAGLLAAAMSSLSTSLNCFSTVFTVDLIRSYCWKSGTDHQYAVLAKWLTAAATLLMIGVAVALFNIEKESYKDLMFRLSAIFGGVMLALFMLAFFAPRVGQRAMWPAFFAALLLNTYLLCIEWQLLPNLLPVKFHMYWIPVVVNGFMILLSLVLAIFLPSRPPARSH